MCSFDVVSLFTNVPLLETIDNYNIMLQSLVIITILIHVSAILCRLKCRFVNSC